MHLKLKDQQLRTILFIYRLLYQNLMVGERRRWRKSKTRRSPSSPQIHQKYIYMWNNPYRTPTERWQKTSDLPKGKKLPRTWVGQKKKEITETKE